MIDAWQVRPPRLVMIAAAVFMIGSQSGVVVSATSTSPGLNSDRCVGVIDPFRDARGDPVADRSALGDYLASALEHIGFQRRCAVLGGHRLGAGLDDVELSVQTVLGPLHVHRPPVVRLDGARVAGQLQDVLIGDAEPSTVGLWCGDVSRRVLRLTLDEDHLHRLVADEAAQHGAVAGEIGRLVDVELVGVDGALNHILAKAVVARHEDGVAKPRLGVDGEHHTGRSDIGAHHLHHADRQGHLEVVEALVELGNEWRDR